MALRLHAASPHIALIDTFCGALCHLYRTLRTGLAPAHNTFHGLPRCRAPAVVRASHFPHWAALVVWISCASTDCAPARAALPPASCRAYMMFAFAYGAPPGCASLLRNPCCKPSRTVHSVLRAFVYRTRSRTAHPCTLPRLPPAGSLPPSPCDSLRAAALVHVGCVLSK